MHVRSCAICLLPRIWHLPVPDALPLPPLPCLPPTNSPPSSMQFPAALARGPTVTLSGLRLNGRPLLPDALAVPQAAAAEGCAVRLLRLSSKVTGARAGFVLSGWLGLGGEAGGEAGDAGGGFGVGEMASLELQLGSYHLLDAATTRLFPGAAAGAAAAAAQQVQRP